MVSVPLGQSDYVRSSADIGQINVRNRFFETTPTGDEGASLLSRPGLTKLTTVGQGPIRTLYTEPGTFADCLFIASGTELYRMETDETTVTLISDGLQSGEGAIEMVAVGNIGDTPEYLFVADGIALYCYSENGFAHANFAISGLISDGEVVRIGSTYYRWSTGTLDSGTPAGTAANPWRVLISGTNAQNATRLFNAINNTGVNGTDYSTALTAHTTVVAYTQSNATFYVRALDPGSAGNSIVTTETGVNTVWSSATLVSGGTPTFLQVVMPDDVGVLGVTAIANYVVVVPDQGTGINGRFYWIEPGATVVEALNFATAERSPDPLVAAKAVGDQLWLFGSNSTEVWYPSGAADLPFGRVQGRTFDRGIWTGTAVPINDEIVVIDKNGTVSLVGSSPQPISDNSIEERIRNAIRAFIIRNPTA